MMNLDKLFDLNGDGILSSAEEALKYMAISGELFGEDEDEGDDEE